MQPRRRRPNQPRRYDPAFREAIPASPVTPRARTMEAADTSRVAMIAIAAIAGILVFVAASYVTHILANQINTATSATPTTGITVNGSVNTAKAQQAKTMAAPADTVPPSQSATKPVSGMNEGYADTYALQGSVGTASARQPAATQQ